MLVPSMHFICSVVPNQHHVGAGSQFSACAPTHKAAAAAGVAFGACGAGAEAPVGVAVVRRVGSCALYRMGRVQGNRNEMLHPAHFISTHNRHSFLTPLTRHAWVAASQVDAAWHAHVAPVWEGAAHLSVVLAGLRQTGSSARALCSSPATGGGTGRQRCAHF